jgi:hypothetical protein
MMFKRPANMFIGLNVQDRRTYDLTTTVARATRRNDIVAVNYFGRIPNRGETYAILPDDDIARAPTAEFRMSQKTQNTLDLKLAWDGGRSIPWTNIKCYSFVIVVESDPRRIMV